MHKITYSWWLDLHVRGFTVCIQTLLAVPRVAWRNLLPFTWGNAGWLCFHHLAVWCFIWLPGAAVSFLTHLRLLIFAFAVLLIIQTNAHSAGHMFLPWKKANPRRAAECVTCFLGRRKMLIFAKAAAARSLSLRLGRSRGATKASWGSNLPKSLGRASPVSICHLGSALLLAHMLRATFSTLALNTVLKNRERWKFKGKLPSQYFCVKLDIRDWNDRNLLFNMVFQHRIGRDYFMIIFIYLCINACYMHDSVLSADPAQRQFWQFQEVFPQA